jgi:hypothetical protein
MTRQTLHQLVEELPEAEIDTAAVLRAVRSRDRALVLSLLAREEDAEDDEIAALAEVSGTTVSEQEARQALK